MFFDEVIGVMRLTLVEVLDRMIELACGLGVEGALGTESTEEGGYGSGGCGEDQGEEGW